MNHFHPIAHRSELEHDGDFVCLPWKADSEVAIVNAGGELFAFDNRCPHRGARIYTDLHGNREPRCAYHARLVTGAIASRLPMIKIGGFLFVSELADAVMPFSAGVFRAAPPLRMHSLFTLQMECHWTVAVENALDFDHVATVHTDSLAKLGLQPFQLQTFEDGSSIENFLGIGVASGTRALRMQALFPDSRDFGRGQVYMHAHAFPFTCLSSTGGWTYSLQHYLPRADGRTTFIHRLYAAESTRPVPEFLASAARMNEQVFREDAAVCATVPAHHRGALGPSERRIAHFRRFSEFGCAL